MTLRSIKTLAAAQVRVWVLLKLFCRYEQFRRVRILQFVKPQLVSVILCICKFHFASTVLLLVFFDSQAGISLRGEVNRVCTVDN